MPSRAPLPHPVLNISQQANFLPNHWHLPRAIYNTGNMATPGRRNTDAVSNETPQLGDPYQFTDPEEEFTFSATDSSQEDFMGFNAQDCRDARRWLLFWVRESPESDSASCNEGRDIFAEGCNTLEFSENRGVNSASSSQSDSSSDPGLKTSKKRSRNPKRCKRNIMKKAKVEGSCYITSSGKVKSPRKQVPPCSCPRKRYW